MRNNRGQALVEYLLIIAVISLIAIGVVKLVGGYLRDTITRSSCELFNKNYVAGERAGEARCED